MSPSPTRLPTDPGLLAEGWRWLWQEENGAAFLTWMHCPSQRTVSVQRHSDETRFSPPAPPGSWFVTCQRHDEHGNPIEGDTLDPFELFNDALRRARAIRRAILAEHPEPVAASQLEMFSEGST